MSACTTMRHVLVGGEALPPALAARFEQRLPRAHLHNAYGPTETTVDATGASMAGCGVNCVERPRVWVPQLLQPCRL